MTPLKAIIFDLDGTLCDTRVDLAHAVNHARRQLGLGALSVDEVTAYVGDGLAKLLQRSFHGDTAKAELARDLFMDHYSQHLLENSPLYDGVAQGLEVLHGAGVPMAVLTNKPEAFARTMVEHYGLAQHMVTVVGGDTFATRKPDPEGALSILVEMGTAPSETLMVGDNHTDLATAQKTGMPSVFCAWGFGRRQGQACDYAAESFGEVVALATRPPAPGSSPSAAP